MGARKYRISGVAVVVGMLLTGIASADELADGVPADLFDLDDAFVTEVGGLTSFAFLPDGRIVITEKSGNLLVRDTDGTVDTAVTFPVDSGSEKGLLNVLPHPAFATNHLLFIYYSLANAAGGTSADRHRVVTVALGDDNTVDLGTEQILVSGLQGPANHDGGALAIGPDGKLYIGTGDTGNNSGHLPTEQNPPSNYFGTCLNVPNGKILRVNLDGSIPADNPLVGVAEATSCSNNDSSPSGVAAPRTDIWAWGFRNAWRFSFDPLTGNLWVGDVGEVDHEEIDVIPQGGGGKHFGWPWREAAFGYPNAKCAEMIPDVGDCVDPVYSCTHSNSCVSMTGGVVIDACEWPEAQRAYYYFGDGANGRIWRLKLSTDRSTITGERLDFATANTRVVHFEAGPDGALYYGTHIGGTSHIARVFPKAPETCGTGGTGGMGGTGGGGAGGTGGSTGGIGGGGVGGTGGGGVGGTGGGGMGGGGTGGGGTGGGGTGGVGGSTGGAGGSSGDAGTSGDGGSAGDAGSAGDGGGSGDGGSAGTSGSGGGGDAGSGGSGASGATGGAGGSSGTGGTGGTGGFGGSLGSSGSASGDSEGDGNCGCRVLTGAPGGALAAFGALALLGLGWRRRR